MPGGLCTVLGPQYKRCAYYREPRKGPQRWKDKSISPVKNSHERWDCSAWNRPKGESHQCAQISTKIKSGYFQRGPEIKRGNWVWTPLNIRKHFLLWEWLSSGTEAVQSPSVDVILKSQLDMVLGSLLKQGSWTKWSPQMLSNLNYSALSLFTPLHLFLLAWQLLKLWL